MLYFCVGMQQVLLLMWTFIGISMNCTHKWNPLTSILVLTYLLLFIMFMGSPPDWKSRFSFTIFLNNWFFFPFLKTKQYNVVQKCSLYRIKLSFSMSCVGELYQCVVVGQSSSDWGGIVLVAINFWMMIQDYYKTLDKSRWFEQLIEAKCRDLPSSS